jgi:hypothetical protein
MEELKPCPFCGSIEVNIWQEPDNGKNWWVDCSSDCCPGGMVRPLWECKTKRLAIKRWNTRTESAWEMFRRLFNKYGSYFRREITKVMNTSTLVRFLADRTEPEAIAIMQQIEKELTE